MHTQINASVHKHRAKMAEEGNARMEVTLGRGLINQAHEFARQKKWPMWRVVEEALVAYVTTGNASVSQHG